VRVVLRAAGVRVVLRAAGVRVVLRAAGVRVVLRATIGVGAVTDRAQPVGSVLRLTGARYEKRGTAVVQDGCADPCRRTARTRTGVVSRSKVLIAIAVMVAAAAGCATADTAAALPLPLSVTAAPAATGATTEGAAGSGAAVVRRECSAADLKVTAGAAQAAAGHSSLVLLLTNSSHASCFLRGYPGVALQLRGGRVYNAARVMTGYMGGDAALSPARVQLASGATASALIEWLHFPRDGSATVTAADCAGDQAVRLLVTVPDQTTSARLAPPGPASPICWGFEVHPVVAGRAGQYPGAGTPSSQASRINDRR
jgi:hypothetical protein